MNGGKITVLNGPFSIAMFEDESDQCFLSEDMYSSCTLSSGGEGLVNMGMIYYSFVSY